MTPAISAISPFFIVANVPAALAFYRDMLGFEITFRGPTPEDEFFGIVHRDGAMIMFRALGEICDGTDVAVEPISRGIISLAGRRRRLCASPLGRAPTARDMASAKRVAPGKQSKNLKL
jgi:catechol 2,3-dioxygenase-like lactoylglutathione lyase family enzyme